MYGSGARILTNRIPAIPIPQRIVRFEFCGAVPGTTTITSVPQSATIMNLPTGTTITGFAWRSTDQELCMCLIGASIPNAGVVWPARCDHPSVQGIQSSALPALLSVVRPSGRREGVIYGACNDGKPNTQAARQPRLQGEDAGHFISGF